MEDLTASIFVDLEAKEYIDGCPDSLVKLRLSYKKPKPNGLPTQEEYEAVNEIEQILELLCNLGTDYYVGRVTVDGHRHYYIYSERTEMEWEVAVEELRRRTGYDFKLLYQQDPQHSGYWNELFPSADDWQVILDLEAIEKMEKLGNDASMQRQIHHYTYFSDRENAKRFVAWAEMYGFDVHDEVIWDDKEESYKTHVVHVGTLKLAELSQHTVLLRQKAEAFGGEYDGWETSVESSESSAS